MIDHDATPGRLDRCQISGSSDLHLIIDLGHQPPCNALLTHETLHQPEVTYPLRLMHCPESGLAQLDYVVEGSEVYPPEYPYRSGISWPLVEYQGELARDVVRITGVVPGAFCVDIGSNDGTLLTHFRQLGLRVLGVEPTNIASFAREQAGIETIQSFFTERLARDILRDYGRAKVVTMTNVFAHMASLGEVMRGLVALLDDDGVFVTESHYLLDVLEKNQFDTIYHEHIRTYSLKSLVTLFPYYGLEVFDVQRGERYSGNIRAYVARRGARPIAAAVGDLLQLEVEIGLHEPPTWQGFRDRVYEQRDRFMEFAYRSHRAGRRLVGYSCPGRATPLLNFYGVRPDILPYIAELPNSLKLGKFVPGVQIPIVSSRRLIDDPGDFVIVLAWHYAEAIAERLRRDGVPGIPLTPLPQFTEEAA
ncbi:MAG: class I SAM-dependent methyltransferase [Candidatus Limnocylindrales bacterium]